MNKKPKGPRSLGDAIGELFARKIIPGPEELIEVRRAWAQLVGERLADQTRVVSFRDGVLVIAVSSSSLIFELESFHRVRLEKEMKKSQALSSVRKIRFEAALA